MNAFQLRRATVDDLPQLIALWSAAQFPVEELEKHFTDFQVAADAEGKVAGIIAMQIANSQGRIHSETFADFALCDIVRPLLWQRLQSVAQNNGLYQLWTTEQAPFWKKDAGFSEPSETQAKAVPEPFGSSAQRWLVLRLRDEISTPENLEKELLRFKEAEKLQREKLMRTGRTVHIIAAIIAGVLFLAAVIVLIRVMSSSFQRPPAVLD